MKDQYLIPPPTMEGQQATDPDDFVIGVRHEHQDLPGKVLAREDGRKDVGEGHRKRGQEGEVSLGCRDASYNSR